MDTGKSGSLLLERTKAQRYVFEDGQFSLGSNLKSFRKGRGSRAALCINWSGPQNFDISSFVLAIKEKDKSPVLLLVTIWVWV